MATLDQPFMLTEWRKVDFYDHPMTPMPTLGYSKEPAFQACRDGAFRFFVGLFVMAQVPQKRVQERLILRFKVSKTFIIALT